MTRQNALSDFSGYRQGSGDHRLIIPGSAEEVRDTVLAANADQFPIRIRGNGHSMTGANIPLSGELVIRTTDLDHYRFETEGTVTVGAGAGAWDVDVLLKTFGYGLPVVPGSLNPDSVTFGPSVGGYAASGGYGKGSAQYGGFWENVRELVVVTGGGELIAIHSGDDLFRWFFGSMGQLGIAVQATLDIVPLAGAEPVYPMGLSGRVELTPEEHPRQLWWQVFGPQARWQELKMAVRRIGLRHPGVWKRRPTFDEAIKFCTFNPPLFYPHQSTMVCVGIFGDQPDDGWDWDQVRALERDFITWSRSDPDVRPHLSAHLIFEDFDFLAHYGKQLLEQFAAMKRKFDPQWLLVPGPLATTLRESE